MVPGLLYRVFKRLTSKFAASEKTSGASIRPRAFRVLFALMVGSLWLLVLALGLRIYMHFDPQSPQRILGKVLGLHPHFQTDPVFGWVPQPGLEQRGLDPDWSGFHRFATDSNGFRSPPPAQNIKGRRYVLLGDSMVWGLGVDQEKMAGSLLRSSLEKGDEVLVTAACGWSTDQEYLFFRERVLPFEPDVLIWLVTPVNDFYQNLHGQTATGFINPKPRFVLDAREHLELVPIDPSAPRESLGESLERTQSVLNLYYKPYDRRYEKALHLTSAILRAGQVLGESHGMKVYFVAFRPWVIAPGIPSYLDLAEDLDLDPKDFSYDKALENIKKVARDAGIDLYYFDSRREMLFRRDAHLNERGNAALARFLEGILAGKETPRWPFGASRVRAAAVLREPGPP